MSGVDGDGDLAVVDVDTTGATALAWGDGESLAVGTAVFGAAATARWRDARHVRPRLGGGPRVPRPGWPADQRQRRAHRSAGAGLVRGALLVDGERHARRPQHEPDRRGLLPGPAGGRRAARADRCPRSWRVAQPRPASASRSPRRTSPDGCVDRSACRIAPACWSVASRTTAWPAAAGIEAGDLIVSAGGKPIADARRPVRGPRRREAPVRGRARARRRGAHRRRSASIRRVERLDRLVPRRLVGRRARRPDRGQRHPARRRPVLRLGRLDDPHRLLARERHRRRVQRPEDAEGARATMPRRVDLRISGRGRRPGARLPDPVLLHALRDLLVGPRRVRAHAAAFGADHRR